MSKNRQTDRKKQEMAERRTNELETTASPASAPGLPMLYEGGEDDTAIVPVFDPRYGGGADPESILAEPPDTLDISAELAAPPRRKLPWLSLVLFAGMIAGLAFAGGAYYQKYDGTAATSSAGAGFTARAGAAAGGTGTGRTGTGSASSEGGFPSGGGAPGGTAGGSSSSGSSTSGTVKLVDGSTIYLTTTSGSIIKVTTGSSTKITKTTTSKTSALLPGQTVTVAGTTDSSGNVTATTVTEG